MSDDLYPSGPWIGFYNYVDTTQRHRMDLYLTFSQGRMTGEGSDDIGPFLIQGKYDVGSNECHWTKQYVGKHSVFYRGFREGRGIWGTWELRVYRGGFHIWPLNSGSTDEMAESKEEAKPIDAIAGEPVQPVHTSHSSLFGGWTGHPQKLNLPRDRNPGTSTR